MVRLNIGRAATRLTGVNDHDMLFVWRVNTARRSALIRQRLVSIEALGASVCGLSDVPFAGLRRRAGVASRPRACFGGFSPQGG